MSLSSLEKTVGIIAGLIPLAEASFYKNSAPHTSAERVLGTVESMLYSSDITPYVGDFPECFSISAASGFVGDYIEYVGMRNESRFLERIGQYFPEIATGIVGVYFTLGETVLPQLLPGSPDIKDVPAVLISALAGYILTKLGRKSGFNDRIFSSIKRTNVEQT